MPKGSHSPRTLNNITQFQRVVCISLSLYVYTYIQTYRQIYVCGQVKRVSTWMGHLKVAQLTR